MLISRLTRSKSDESLIIDLSSIFIAAYHNNSNNKSYLLLSNQVSAKLDLSEGTLPQCLAYRIFKGMITNEEITDLIGFFLFLLLLLKSCLLARACIGQWGFRLLGLSALRIFRV